MVVLLTPNNNVVLTVETIDHRSGTFMVFQVTGRERKAAGKRVPVDAKAAYDEKNRFHWAFPEITMDIF